MDVIELPLHKGKAPRWLFYRMVKLGKAISEAIILEFGVEEFLKRLSDALWFQAFSCALGFDWHSSGTTTVTLGALKKAFEGSEELRVVGGKGMAKKIPEEIEKVAKEFELDSNRLKLASKLSAKVDTAGLLDGFNLYHHAMIITSEGKWLVIQQGMLNEWARRYHIHMPKSFVSEPHSSIISEKSGRDVINLVAKEKEAKKAVVDLVNEAPSLRAYFTAQSSLLDFSRPVRLPKAHYFNTRVYERVLQAYEQSPSNFEELLLTNLGPKSMRALALLAELIYDVELPRKDPVKYSFVHGGKDGVPYPVDRKTYDKSIQILLTAVEEAKIGKREKLKALKRLSPYLAKNER